MTPRYLAWADWAESDGNQQHQKAERSRNSIKVERFGLGCQKSCVQPGIYSGEKTRLDKEIWKSSICMTDNKSS